ncbi:MAG: hypothetical protein WCG83_05805 [Candidatus Peregrinibacteria bacterium]
MLPSSSPLIVPFIPSIIGHFLYGTRRLRYIIPPMQWLMSRRSMHILGWPTATLLLQINQPFVFDQIHTTKLTSFPGT